MNRLLAISIVGYGVGSLAIAHQDIIPEPATVKGLLTAAGLGVALVLAWVVRAHARRIGGLTFVRLGRLSFSYCITRR